MSIDCLFIDEDGKTLAKLVANEKTFSSGSRNRQRWPSRRR